MRAKQWLRGLLQIGVLVAVCGLVAISCSSSTPENNGAQGPTTTEPPLTPVPGGRLVFGLSGEPDGYLPQASRWSPSAINEAKTVFDPLVVIGADGKSYPYLAESITPTNATFTEWNMKMRPGVKFHNGEPLNADAIMANMKAYRESALSSSAFKPITDVKKVDELTVAFTTSMPWANLPTLFTVQTGYIVAPAQLAANDTKNPIGTGPFKFVSWTTGQSFKVTKSSDYWQKGMPYLSDVEFKIIPDEATRFKALDAGDIDILETSAPDQIMRATVQNNVPANAKVLLDESPGNDTMVIINTQTGILQDKNLRLALAMATDQKKLVDNLFDGAFEVADQTYDKSSPWHTDNVGYPAYNPDQAKKLVDSWKSEHGGGAPTIQLGLVAGASDQIGQALQEQWQQAGFQISLNSADETKFTANFAFGKFEAVEITFPYSIDPDSSYYFWSSQTLGKEGDISLNFARYANATTDKALNDGRASTDEQVRRQAYDAMWKDFAQNIPYIYLYYSKSMLVYSDHVHGVGQAKTPEGQTIMPIVFGSTFITNTWIEH